VLTTNRWITSIATISALCAVAEAESPEADALFARGLRLAATNPAEACEAFEASHQSEPRAGTSINIGLCRERLGQFASAWNAFKEALRRVKDPAKRRLALERLAAIEPQLSYLTISVADIARAPAITLDGRTSIRACSALESQSMEDVTRSKPPAPVIGRGAKRSRSPRAVTTSESWSCPSHWKYLAYLHPTSASSHRVAKQLWWSGCSASPPRVAASHSGAQR
jgi:hypothetical protein